MKISAFEKRIPAFPRVGALAGMVLILLAALQSGCKGGLSDDGLGEGDRCNPLDVHGECSSGLVCTGQGTNPAVAGCAENYCCPLDSNGNITGSNPSCQPGCNGGALPFCLATKDPTACALAFPDAGAD